MTASHAKLKGARRALVAKKNPQAARVLAASEEATPTGMKLKASMQLYAKAEKRGSKERRAVAKMVAKAKTGDKQALADVQALKLAAIAVKADRAAAKHVQVLAVRQARAAKIKAVQKKIEVAMSDKLIRQSRSHQLAKVAKIERRAAAGDKKCQKIVAVQVAKAKKGDKKAVKVVRALALAKVVRTTAPTRKEKHNLALASKKVRQIARGNKKALRDARVIAAAAKHGNPNAKRAQKRMQVASAVELTLKTGAIVLPGAAIGVMSAQHTDKRKIAEKQVGNVEQKIANKTASREEVVAAARTAANLGDKEKASELLSEASRTPSAGEELKRVATVVAAAEAGNPKTRENLVQAERLASEGDSRGIEAMGKLMAVKNLDQVSKGRNIDPEMKAAVKDIEAAADGNETAQTKIANMQAQAAERNPAAIKYMVAATGAAVVARALASNEKARDEWRGKAGVAPANTENENVVVDAVVVTPGMTSLPDAPLPPVRGIFGFLRESAKALLFATRDPFQNYREGIQGKARLGIAPVTSAGAEKKTDPEAKYRVHAKKVEKTLESKTPDEEYEVHGDAPLTLDTKPLMDWIEKQHKEIENRAAQGDPKAVKSWARIQRNRAMGASIFKAYNDDLIDRASHGDSDAQKKLVERDRLLPIGKKIDTSLLGDAPPTPIDEETKKRLVNDAKNRFGAIKNAAAAGDKQAQKKWQNVVNNYMKNSTLAAKGDARAKDVVSILAATGLFTT